MLKKLLATATLTLASGVTLASGGPWDGIYSCGITVASFTTQAYITINGYPDGRAIFAVAAVTPSTDFYGYGVGSVSGSIFSGTTMFGQPFRVVANPSGFSGTVGIVSGGYVFNAITNCTRIW